MAIDTQEKRQLVLRGYSGILADPPPSVGVGLVSSLMLMGVGMSIYGISLIVGMLYG